MLKKTITESPAYVACVVKVEESLTNEDGKWQLTEEFSNLGPVDDWGENIVYILQCLNCKYYYVGETADS